MPVPIDTTTPAACSAGIARIARRKSGRNSDVDRIADELDRSVAQQNVEPAAVERVRLARAFGSVRGREAGHAVGFRSMVVAVGAADKAAGERRSVFARSQAMPGSRRRS